MTSGHKPKKRETLTHLVCGGEIKSLLETLYILTSLGATFSLFGPLLIRSINGAMDSFV